MQKLIPVKGKKASEVKTKPKETKNIPEEEREFVDAFMTRLAAEDKMDNLFNFYDELEQARATLSKDSYEMLKEQISVRASSLFDNTGKIILMPGEIYIFTQPVKAEKIPEGYRVVLDTFDPENGIVTLSKVGRGRKKTFDMTINDFNSVAMSEEQFNNLPKEEETYTPSQEELDHLSESMINTGEELSDFVQLAKWEEEASADNVDLDTLKNNFFESFKC
jgi:hypothetical protein